MFGGHCLTNFQGLRFQNASRSARVPQVREPGFCELTWEIDVRLSLSHQHSKI
jgi:hypothetical protein